MNDISPLFDVIFSWWPNDVAMAADMRVERRCARQWVARGYVPMRHWPRLRMICEEKFGRQISRDDMVDALLARKAAEPRKVRELKLYSRADAA